MAAIRPLPCAAPGRRAAAILPRLLATSLIALGAAGCLGKAGPFASRGGTPNLQLANTEDQLRKQSEELGRRYEANPNDRNAALAYAQALRALRQEAQAVAVLENAAIRAPQDNEVLAAYGKALIDVGRFKQASEVLNRAQRPDRPDWRILSAQGSAADQMGDHANAQKFYEAALKIVPDEPTVLSNLGLSYALAKKLPEAEGTLRKAAQNPRADGRVRQNLALVLGLQGKFGEAENLVKQDMPAQDAAASMAYLRRVVAQTNSWSAMRDLDKNGQPTGKARNVPARASAQAKREAAPSDETDPFALPAHSPAALPSGTPAAQTDAPAARPRG